MSDPKVDPRDLNHDGTVTAQEIYVYNSGQTQNQNTSGSGYSEVYTDTGKSFQITPKETAYSTLDQDMMAMFGRRATASEKSAYFSALNKLEKTYYTASSGKTTRGSTGATNKKGQTLGGGGQTSTSTNYLFDPNAFRFEYVSNLAATYVQQGKPLGGKAGQVYNDLTSYANSMGVHETPQSIMKSVVQTIQGKTDATAISNNYRTRAISLYGGIADRLQKDPSLTVKDVAQDYINTLSNMLDLPANTIDLKDPMIQSALNSVKDGKPYAMNLSEFQTLVRSDSRFQYSSMAHKEANDLASSFANAFGYGG